MKKSEIHPIPVVLVGCGAVSQEFYAPSLGALFAAGICTLRGLVDPSSTGREILARRFQNARKANQISEVPDSIAPPGSLCVVAAPPKYHISLAAAAFERGWHVLCEKPMASSSKECASMIEAASTNCRLLAVGHYKRFMPAHQAIKLIVENQIFGRLREVSIAEGGKFTWPAASDSFFLKDTTPGGVLLDTGVHVLDLLLWWLGPPKSFEYAHDARDGLEANCLLTAEFSHPGLESDSVVKVRTRLSRDWPTENCYFFRFDDAALHCRVNASNRLEITFNGLPMTFASELREPNLAEPTAQTLPLESNAQAFIAQLQDVCLAVGEGRPPKVAGEDGARAIRWIEECYASAKLLPEPWQGSANV